MNLGLLDPQQIGFPDVIEEYLDHRSTRCIAFNRRGTLLAAGCLDGTCVVWDFETRGVARDLVPEDLKDKVQAAPSLPGRKGEASPYAVLSVCWSRKGHKLLASLSDKRLILWDVLSGAQEATVSFDEQVMHARMHPADDTTCLACPIIGPPLLVNLKSGEKEVLPTALQEEGQAPVTSKGVKSDSGQTSQSSAEFSKRGDLIFIGTVRGELLVVDSKSKEVRGALQMPGSSQIKQIVLSRDGKFLLTNSADRVIRGFGVQLPKDGAAQKASGISELLKGVASEGRPNAGGGTSSKKGGSGQQQHPLAHLHNQSPFLLFLRDFSDVVNRTQWRTAAFSNDGELVVGASADPAEHRIHLWNRAFGQLSRILEGPKETLRDVAWHPTRPILASVGEVGVVYLWAKDYTEQWSAFAPDFKELEENEEYVEREDEFDINPRDEDKAKASKSEELEEDVDILGVDRVAVYSDSDDSQECLYFLPTVPERDKTPPPELDPEETVSRPPSSGGKPLASSGGKPNGKGRQRGGSEDEEELVMAVEGQFEEEDLGGGRGKRKRKLTEKLAESRQLGLSQKPSQKLGKRKGSGKLSVNGKGGSNEERAVKESEEGLGIEPMSQDKPSDGDGAAQPPRESSGRQEREVEDAEIEDLFND